MATPTNTSLGVLGSLLCKLDSLQPVVSEDGMRPLKGYLKETHGYLDKLSLLEEPTIKQRTWMKEVRELSYDMEVQLDRKLLSAEEQVQEFSAHLQEAIERYKRYNLNDPPLQRRFLPISQQPTTPYAEVADLFLGVPGEDVKRLINDKQELLKVVAIVGPGGVGKTTLAQMLYQQVGGEFDCQAFVRVTRKPDMKRLLRDILLQVRSHQPADACGVQQLIDDIKEHLCHRRYLIVMDDICATSLWHSIRRAVPEGSSGSRIIITGQIEEVALTCCGYHPEYIFKMKYLSMESSKKLFFRIAFGSEDNCPNQARDDSLQIIERCGGLPLTIVSIASLLSSFVARDQDVTAMMQQWKHVNNLLGSILYGNFTPEVTKQALNLCYNYLPLHLKTCLLYLTIYPEDYMILKDDLLKLWVAEGFVTAVGGQEQAIEEAGKYFDELVQRRLIQPVDINDNSDVSSCTLHSMVLDLIASKSVEDNFMAVLDKYQGLIGLSEKVRRLALHFGNTRHANAPECISLLQVRSLSFFGFYKCIPQIEEFELVRVLVLQIWGDNCGTTVDLRGISELHHLIYLKVACDTVIDLPTQIRQLQNLTTIEIDAMSIGVFPSDIVDLPGLLHLFLPLVVDMPDRIGDMSSLCTLGYFDLSKYSKDMVHSLCGLTNLQHLHLTCSSATSIHLVPNFKILGSIIENLCKLKSITVVPGFLHKKSLAPGASAVTISWGDLSHPPPLLQNMELSPRICTFSHLPSWTRQLSKLSTLKIAVHELSKIDVGVLEELSTLTILSLHVKNAPAERIGFHKGKFPALKSFKFICSVPWLEFEEGTMPNLQKLHLGFNAHGAAVGGHAPVGMTHLLSLQVLRGVIGCFLAEQSDRKAAEYALRNITSVHGTRPLVNIRWVDWNFYDNRSMHSVFHGILSSSELIRAVSINLEKTETLWTDSEHKFQQSEMSDWTMATIPVVHVELYADRREVCSVATIPDSSVKSCINQVQQIIQAGALGVYNELTELLKKMQQIHKFLVAGMRIEVYSTVIWLSNIKDAMSEADAIIDSLRSEGAQESQASSSSPTSLITCIQVQFLSCVHTVQKRPKINAKTKNRTTKIKISELQQRVKTLADTEPIVKASPWLRNISHLLEPNLEGKEMINASEKLADWVAAQPQKGKNVQKLAIVGRGGVGKTTLAQKVYNHQKVRGIFSKQAWICVSREYSDSTLLKELLKNIGTPQEKELRTEELRSKLSEAVKGKSLFLVLDNVWTSQVWTDLLQTPIDAAATATILVTTQNIEVTQAIGVQNVHQVQLMTREDGWELFWKSMHINEEEEVKNMKEIGMQIVDKCGGLPLAIKAVAGVLATKDKSKKQWKKILRNNAWSTSEPSTELHGAFYLSYEDLQPYLKKCFLYCALFPEKWTMNRDDLVRFWVAEGFVEDKENQLLEESAEKYYYELVYRNLLEPEPIHFGHQWCKVHDLLRQLALCLSREEFFSGDPESLDSKTYLSKLRYISVVTGKNMIHLPAMGTGLKGVRTLIFNGENSTSIESAIFQQFHHVKVLDLTGLRVGNLTEYIGKLVHLRLLDLDGTDVSCIPESIGSLRGLEVLNLQRCDSLHSLPSAITKLCNLRRLGLGGTRIDEVPGGIGNLKFLTDLEGFPIGAGRDNTSMQDGWKLEELASLVQLRRLDVVKLGKALPCGKSSFLEDKEHLKFVVLRCTEESTDKPYPENVRNIEKIFEELIPPKNLEDLAIDRFFGRCYPMWLGTHLPSVKHLTLANCISCEQLPPVGQLPNLKYLRIVGATAVTRIGPEFIGHGVGNPSSSQAVAFPMLECLEMRDMTSWAKWSFVEEDEIQHESTPGNKEMALHLLPRLKELQLVNCPKIRSLPQHLAQASSLKVLQLRWASSLNVLGNFPCLSGTLVLATCGNLETISNLPLVRVLRLQKCPNLKSVENLDNLHHLWLTEDMKDTSSQWLPQLQEQHRRRYNNEFDVYTWR